MVVEYWEKSSIKWITGVLREQRNRYVYMYTQPPIFTISTLYNCEKPDIRIAFLRVLSCGNLESHIGFNV